MQRVDVRDLERRFEDRLRTDPSALGSADVADRVLEASGSVRGLRVLDVGCGTGGLCRRLANRDASVVGVDVCANLLTRARALVPAAGFVRADAGRLPFGTGRFDLAASVLVLHYLEDPSRALAEMARVLRPGGKLLLCDRVCSSDPVLSAAQIGIERLRNPMIRRILSVDELEDGLSRAGFRVGAQVEFRRTEPLESWLSGTDPDRALDVREEVLRLRGRDLGGFRVAPQDRIEFRMALLEASLAAG